jgi:hypothetical protein
LSALIVFSVLIWLAIKKELPAPVVNVPAPVVNVPAPVVNVDSVSVVPEPYSVDAFNRMRVSETFTLSDSKNVHTADAEYNNLTVNGGSILHLPDEASYRLSVTGQAGSRCVKQTRMYHNYQPGKSQVSIMSFKFGAVQSGIIRRVGYFDDDNGVYLEQNGTTGTYNLVRREKTSGLVTNHIVPRSQWDNQVIDPDFSKVQLLKIDFQWLGVGKIRFFLSNSTEELVHTFYLADINDTVSFSEPNLPVRYEILNDSFVGGPGDSFSMQMICTTTMSEGGYSEVGLDRHAGTGNLHRTIQNGGDELPIIAIRLKSSFEGKPNRYYVRPGDYSIYVETHPVLFKVYRLESESQILDGSWVSAGVDSPVDYNISATGYSLVGGYQELNGGIIGATTAQKSSGALNSGNPSRARKEMITQNLDSTDSQVWVIVCQALTSGTNVNSKVWAAIQWREVY